ncbi:unannotated protein [freshwater metagenome]|uniref:Unannotated protein n=1 Tax=freshwater metagenome TaxID=449393 RepID=A0A6J6QUJ4_9ZZZZ
MHVPAAAGASEAAASVAAGAAEAAASVAAGAAEVSLDVVPELQAARRPERPNTTPTARALRPMNFLCIYYSLCCDLLVRTF